MKTITKNLLVSSLCAVAVASTAGTIAYTISVYRPKETKTWEQVSQLKEDIKTQYVDSVEMKKQDDELTVTNKKKIASGFSNTVNNVAASDTSPTATYNNLLILATSYGLEIVDWASLDKYVEATKLRMCNEINSMVDVSAEEKKQKIDYFNSRVDALIKYCKDNNYSLTETTNYFYNNIDTLFIGVTTQEQTLKNKLVLSKIIFQSSRNRSAPAKTTNDKKNDDVLYLNDLEDKKVLNPGQDLSSYLPNLCYQTSNKSQYLINSASADYTLRANFKECVDNGFEHKLTVKYSLVNNDAIETKKEQEMTVEADDDTEFIVAISPFEERHRCDEWWKKHELSFKNNVFYDKLKSLDVLDKQMEMNFLVDYLFIDKDKELTLENTEGYLVNLTIKKFDDENNEITYMFQLCSNASDDKQWYNTNLTAKRLDISAEYKNKVFNKFSNLVQQLATFNLLKRKASKHYLTAFRTLYIGSLILGVSCAIMIIYALVTHVYPAIISAAIAVASFTVSAVLTKLAFNKIVDAERSLSKFIDDNDVKKNIDNFKKIIDSWTSTANDLKLGKNISYAKMQEMEKGLDTASECLDKINAEVKEKNVKLGKLQYIFSAQNIIALISFIAGLAAFCTTIVLIFKTTRNDVSPANDEGTNNVGNSNDAVAENSSKLRSELNSEVKVADSDDGFVYEDATSNESDCYIDNNEGKFYEMMKDDNIEIVENEDIKLGDNILYENDEIISKGVERGPELVQTKTKLQVLISAIMAMSFAPMYRKFLVAVGIILFIVIVGIVVSVFIK